MSRPSAPSHLRAIWAETAGTFLLVFFGLGSLHSAVLSGAQVGLRQVAVVWGLGVALAIYATADISGAHLNPAITLAFALYRGFPARRVASYVLAQVAGAFLAAVVLYGLYAGVIRQYEAHHGLVRGAPGSERSAMIYGEYFPNPGLFPAERLEPAPIGSGRAMGAEATGTALLAFCIFALTDERNRARPGAAAGPLLIGLAVAAIISVVGPITQAGLNPARDFGPRLFACLAGWNRIAIPGPRGGFFSVYILSPAVGAVVGAGLQQLLRVPVRFKRAEPEPGNTDVTGDLS